MNKLIVIPKKIKDELRRDKNVLAVALFGSCARGEKFRDIDIVLFLNKKLPNIEMSKIKLKYSSLFSSKFDIKVFQQLPVYIRIQVLKECKILLCKNYDVLYEIAFLTIKEFGFYKKLYEMYLENVTK
jgi:uncharacterized protein